MLVLAACTPDLGSSTRGWSPAVAAGGVVYVASQEGKLIALTDDGTGVVAVKWTFPAGDNQLGGVFSSPLVGDDLVYVSAVDGTLYAIGKDSGTLNQGGWTTSLVQDTESQHLVSGPTLDASQSTLVVGSEDHHLYAINARNGEEKWKFPAGDKIWTTPTINGDTVYFGSHDKNVYAVDLATGEEKWRFATEGAVVARPLVWRNMVVIGSFDRTLYALDIEDGTEVWSFDGANNWFWSGAVANTSFVFAPSLDGKVYALDRGGNLQWTYDVESPVVADPVLVPRGLVVASRDGDVTLINTTSGTSINRFSDIKPSEIRAPLFTLPVSDDSLSTTGIQPSGDDQKESIFVGVQDGTVYRIQAKSGLVKVWCFDTREDNQCG